MKYLLILALFLTGCNRNFNTPEAKLGLPKFKAAQELCVTEGFYSEKRFYPTAVRTGVCSFSGKDRFTYIYTGVLIGGVLVSATNVEVCEENLAATNEVTSCH